MKDSVSMEALWAAMKLVDGLPPPAMFASWVMFPRDHALTFKADGRDYVGAHPDFWKQIPASERGRAQSLSAIEIADFSLPYYSPQKAEFLAALMQVMAPNETGATS